LKKAVSSGSTAAGRLVNGFTMRCAARTAPSEWSPCAQRRTKSARIRAAGPDAHLRRLARVCAQAAAAWQSHLHQWLFDLARSRGPPCHDRTHSQTEILGRHQHCRKPIPRTSSKSDRRLCELVGIPRRQMPRVLRHRPCAPPVNLSGVARHRSVPGRTSSRGATKCAPDGSNSRTAYRVAQNPHPVPTRRTRESWPTSCNAGPENRGINILVGAGLPSTPPRRA